MRKLASIQIGNKPFYIDAVLSFLDMIASKHPNMEHGRYNRFRFVVGEVLEQRILHAYPDRYGTLDVEFFIDHSCFEVSVKDKGVPAWTDFSFSGELDSANEQELRNFFLQRMVDGIGLEKLGKDGQRIYIFEKLLHKGWFQPPTPYEETVVLDTNLTIRPVQTHEDAIEAIRCIYSEYGYSYSYERLYYPDTLLSLIERGELMSFLAVNDHGQIAGHFLLSFSDTFRNMPEISTVVTRKEFRGLGLFGKFMDYSLALAKERGFRALMGQPVGFHPMSQKAFLRSDFVPTSLLLSYISSDIESEYNREGARLDLFACVRLMDKTASTTVYPPVALLPFVEKTFSALGYAFTAATERTKAEYTQMRIEHATLMASTKILLTSAADDWKTLLKDTVKDCILRKHEMIELLISLNDPSCEYAYLAAKSCGFALSGLLPCSESGDYLVMQFAIGRDFCYDQLVTVGAFETLTHEILALEQPNGKE